MAATPPNNDCHHYASASEQKNEATRAAWIERPGTPGHRSGADVLQQQGLFYNNDTPSHRSKHTAWCFAALCCGLTIVCLAIWFAVHRMDLSTDILASPSAARPNSSVETQRRWRHSLHSSQVDRTLAEPAVVA